MIKVRTLLTLNLKLYRNCIMIVKKMTKYYYSQLTKLCKNLINLRKNTMLPNY